MGYYSKGIFTIFSHGQIEWLLHFFILQNIGEAGRKLLSLAVGSQFIHVSMLI